MNWRNFLTTGKLEPVQAKAVPDAPVGIEREGPYYEIITAEEMLYDLFSSLRTTQSYSDSDLIALFHSVPEIFAPIHEIASRVSDAVWELRKWTNDQVIYDDADFNRLFSTPNPLFSFKKFIYQAVCYELVTGKQYFYFNIPDTLAFDWRNIAAWWNLPADRVVIDVPKNLKLFSATEVGDIIKNYYIRNSDGTKTDFKPSKVLTIHQLNLGWAGRHINGKSPLLSAEKAIRNLVAVYEARFSIYDKRGMIGILSSNKGDQSGKIALTRKEKEAVLEDINGRYGVTKGRNPLAVTSEPITHIQTSMSIADLQPFDETLADAIAIYKTLRVPRHLVPSKDNSTFSNAESDMRSFYADVIVPIANQYAEGFTNYFRLNTSVTDGRLRRYIAANFSHIDVLQENKKEKAQVDKINGDVYEKRFLNGVCTLNEWIVAAGGEKITEPVYDKRIFEMTPEELEIIRAGLNLKAAVKPKSENQNEEENDQENTVQDS